VDLFLFFRGLRYEMMWIPLLRVDILGWLFFAGYAVFGIWWNPLTGQSKWTPLSGALSAASFLVVALTFTLLFNKSNLFRKGWSKTLSQKAVREFDQVARALELDDRPKAELIIGSGESVPRRVTFSKSSFFLTLEHDKTRGLEFPFNETTAELGMLYCYFLIRPAVKLRTKALGEIPAYVFKADPAVLFTISGLITSYRTAPPPATSKKKKALVSVALAAGMLVSFTFGLWRITTITHPEPTYPVGIINSNQVALYELSTTQSRLIANLRLGDEVLLIKDTENWYYVLTPDEQSGYVAKGFVDAKLEK
jgi:hypothetical protein